MEDILINVNFDGVVATADKSYTRPGVIDVFKITKVEFGKSKTKQTLGMTLTFENSNSVFSETFYFAGSDEKKTKTMLGRIQALVGYIHGENTKLSGNLTGPMLIAKLLNKELALKIIGEVSNTGKGYARLPFAGFGKSTQEVNFLKFTATEEAQITATLEAIENSRSSRSDSESAGNDYALVGDDTAPPIQSENF